MKILSGFSKTAVLLMLLLPFQTKPAEYHYSPWSFYEGSTPGGNYIKSVLKIPGQNACEFMKWHLTLAHHQYADSFNIFIRYGESQPNTNDFKNGGYALRVSGKYKVISPGKKHTKPVIELHSTQTARPLFLLQLSDEVFYLLDEKKAPLVGNGGFSYLLNKKNV